MVLTTKQTELRINQLVKKTLLIERANKGLGTFQDMTHPIAQFRTMMVAHNDVVGVINSLIDYVEVLKQRVEELENGRG